MKNCVYRFLNKDDEVIYVGKAKYLKQRMNTHFSESGHLPNECYKKTCKIEFISCNSISEMNIKELYYINKYKPIYNIKDKYEEDSIYSIDIFDSLTWKKYNLRYFKYIDKVENLENIINEKDLKILNLEKKIFDQLESILRYKYLSEQYEKLLLEYESLTNNKLISKRKKIVKNPYWSEDVSMSE